MRRRNRLLLAIGLFLATYLAVLGVWIQVKPLYGTVLSHLGVRLAGWSAGMEVKDIRQGRDRTRIALRRPLLTQGGLADFIVELEISVSNYSFNVPVTFALIAALFPFFKWRGRTLLEAALILVLIHLLYIVFFSALELFKQLTQSGVIRPPSKAFQYAIQFLWAFTDNLVIRFEPFLVCVYLWLRNARFMPPLPRRAPV